MTHIPTLLSHLQIKAAEVNTVRLEAAAWQLGDPLPQIQGTRPYLLIMDIARSPRALLTRPVEADAIAYTCLWCEARWFGHDTDALAAPGTLTREKLELALEHYGLMLRDVAAGSDAGASTPELIPLLRPRWRSDYPVASDPILRYAALGITLWYYRRNAARLIALEEALMPLLPGQDTPALTQSWKAFFALRLTEVERQSVRWLGNGLVQAPAAAHVRRRLRLVAHLATLQRMVRCWQAEDKRRREEGIEAVPGNILGITDVPPPPSLLAGAEAARQISAFLPPAHPWVAFLRSKRTVSRKGTLRASTEKLRSAWEMVDGDIEDLARAFPPCINAILAKKQDHLRHDTRFTVACYLSACGVNSPEDFLRLAEPGKLEKDVPSFMSAITTAKKKHETFPRGQSCKVLARKGLCPYAGDTGKCGTANNLKHTFYNPLFFTIQLLRQRKK